MNVIVRVRHKNTVLYGSIYELAGLDCQANVGAYATRCLKPGMVLLLLLSFRERGG